jgi:hypothetical protein
VKGARRIYDRDPNRCCLGVEYAQGRGGCRFPTVVIVTSGRSAHAACAYHVGTVVRMRLALGKPVKVALVDGGPWT